MPDFIETDYFLLPVFTFKDSVDILLLVPENIFFILIIHCQYFITVSIKFGITGRNLYAAIKFARRDNLTLSVKSEVADCTDLFYLCNQFF